jgi:hypothetical protein
VSFIPACDELSKHRLNREVIDRGDFACNAGIS